MSRQQDTQKSANWCAPKTECSDAACGVQPKRAAFAQPEIHDPELLAIATRIASKVLGLSIVAAEAMEMVVDRYVVGQERYGEPDVDGRDWIRELEEEEIDRVAYRPLIRIAASRRRRRLHVDRIEIPTVAISSDGFDLSDSVELVHPLDEEPTIERVVVAHTEGGR